MNLAALLLTFKKKKRIAVTARRGRSIEIGKTKINGRTEHSQSCGGRSNWKEELTKVRRCEIYHLPYPSTIGDAYERNGFAIIDGAGSTPDSQTCCARLTEGNHGAVEARKRPMMA
jgi:hypothetical protein